MLGSIDTDQLQHGITTLEAIFSLAIIGILFAGHASLLQSAFRTVFSAQQSLIEAESQTTQPLCRSAPLPGSTDFLLLCEATAPGQNERAFINANSVEATE